MNRGSAVKEQKFDTNFTNYSKFFTLTPNPLSHGERGEYIFKLWFSLSFQERESEGEVNYV